jgi:transposase
LSTKIHAAVDALGKPVRLILTPGQSSESQQAEMLIAGFQADAVIADKGYDADAILSAIEAAGSEAVVPPKANRIVQRGYDKLLYKERNRVERFFQAIKNYRRIATRYERLAATFSAMLHLVACVVWLTN